MLGSRFFVAFVVFVLGVANVAQADTFGSGSNAFAIDFVAIGNAGNAAVNGYGAVPYEYRIGKYEISQTVIAKATAGGLANVSAVFITGTGPAQWPMGSQPAAGMSWYEAAAFVNWMNTSSGKQAAYDLSWNGSSWQMNLWSSGNAWTLGGTNLYRHKDAFYFLPSENEWFKAAFYNPGSTVPWTQWWQYATANGVQPTAVLSGTSLGTAVFGQSSTGTQPAAVDAAGGLSAYGTMGQGGNIQEMVETAFDGINDSVSELRTQRGGFWSALLSTVHRDYRFEYNPVGELNFIGLRVASVPAVVPEPSTYAMALASLACGGFSVWRRRKRA